MADSGFSMRIGLLLFAIEALGLAGAAPALAGTAARRNGCKRGLVKQNGHCVSNRPVRYGSVQLHIATAGTYKLKIEPSHKALAALHKGKTLHVTMTVVFTPAGTSDQISKVVTTTVHLAQKRKRGSLHELSRWSASFPSALAVSTYGKAGS